MMLSLLNSQQQLSATCYGSDQHTLNNVGRTACHELAAIELSV
jgi:hypothetical protein